MGFKPRLIDREFVFYAYCLSYSKHCNINMKLVYLVLDSFLQSYLQYTVCTYGDDI